jgi:stage III sporulation protein AA
MFQFLAPHLREILERSSPSDWEEVRLRVNQPLVVKGRTGYCFLSPLGRVVPKDEAYRPTPEDLARTVQILTNSSWYAWEDEIRRGYLTIPGGHRVGICGRAVLDGGKVKTVKSVSSLSIRLARAVPGCADSLMPHICPKGREVLSTLVISPPGCGKTTLLRDLARQISQRGFQVVVIDERSEIAACYQGSAQLDVGPQTDVLDGYPKAEGVAVAVRALSPQVVVTDEIGHPDDGAALAELARSGVKVLASCHGDSLAQVEARSWARDSLPVFQLAVVLSRRSGPGTVEQVLSLRSGT